ncbi:MAG: SMP-30/gluconolactonase/LRE family protein [Actinobacteria bacterium]|nr:SMP-30/gluconolactonase/LRE family protein [Actinomycetota bacterium]
MSSEPEVVVHAHPQHGEGPVWVDGVLYWVDIMGESVHRFDPTTGQDTATPVGQAVGALVPRSSGGLVLAVRDGFAELPSTGDAVRMLAGVEADQPATRMNDGKCDRQGRFWASTMAFDATPEAGSLYCLTPELDVRKVLDRLTIGNGLAWSEDDRTFYFIDSMTHGVDAYEFDGTSGELGERRQLFEIPEEDGLPDGMTIDADGYLWVALFNGWAVRRYSPEGVLDREIRLPVANVTCPTFGGDDLTDLYITTTPEGLSEKERQEQPLAGAVFRVRSGVTGVAASAFGG